MIQPHSLRSCTAALRLCSDDTRQAFIELHYGALGAIARLETAARTLGYEHSDEVFLAPIPDPVDPPQPPAVAEAATNVSALDFAGAHSRRSKPHAA